jgi:hypothetical protein
MNEHEKIGFFKAIPHFIGRTLTLVDKVYTGVEETVDAAVPYVQTAGVYGEQMVEDAKWDTKLNRIESAADFKEREIELKQRIHKLQNPDESNVINSTATVVKSTDDEIDEILSLFDDSSTDTDNTDNNQSTT